MQRSLFRNFENPKIAYTFPKFICNIIYHQFYFYLNPFHSVPMEQSLLTRNYFKKFIYTLFITTLFSISSFGQNCTVNAGVLNVTICETDALVLEGSTPSPIIGTVLWSQISGPTVVINSPNSTSTTVSGYTGGNTYIFRYSAVCGDGILTFQDKVVNVKPITLAQAGGDVASCPNSLGTLTITANTPKNTGETGFGKL